MKGRQASRSDSISCKAWMMMHCSEWEVREVADAMLQNGMRELGFNFIVRP